MQSFILFCKFYKTYKKYKILVYILIYAQLKILKFLNKSMDANLITAVLASVIALLALFVSIWQGVITRRHNRLSVRPVLHFFSGELPSENSEKTTYHIHIENRGLGPAITKNFKVYYKNHPLKDRDLQITESNLLSIAADMATYKETVVDKISSRTLTADSMLSPGDKMELPLVEFDEQDTMKRANVITNLYEIDVRITYTSLHWNEHQEVGLIEKTNTKKFPPLISQNLPKIRERYPSIFR